MSYVRTSAICFLLVYFVSAAGCHCFDFLGDLAGFWLVWVVFGWSCWFLAGLAGFEF